MKLSAILEPMIAAGVSGDVILATVRAYEEQREDALERRRESDRIRQAAKRSRDSRDSSTVTHGHDLAPDPAHVEDNLLPKKISGQEENKQENAPKARGGDDLADFKSELADLDADRLEAIIKHRRSKRGQLTGLSARLFRGDAQSCGLSLADAVDACISRNWITVKPEYFAGRNQHRSGAGPPAEPRTVGELAIHRIKTGQSRNEPTSYANGRVDSGDGRGQAPSARGAQLIAIAGKSIGRID